MNPERGILRSRGADGAHDRDSATRVGLVTPESGDGAQIRDREERVRWPAAPAQLTREWSSSIHVEVLIRIPPRFVLEDATAVPERGKTPELLPGVHRKASVRPQRLATRRPSTQSILALKKLSCCRQPFRRSIEFCSRQRMSLWASSRVWASPRPCVSSRPSSRECYLLAIGWQTLLR